MKLKLPIRDYPSKILIFGEYAVIFGAKALAIPHTAHSGKWISGTATFEENIGKKFFNYLLQHEKLSKVLNLDLLQESRQSNLNFSSNIPHGFGLGSSGAICAGIYDIFAYRKEENPNLLKTQLSWIESFFHGASSGIDPLVSYLKKPVINEKSEVSLMPTVMLDQKPFQFFLLNSKQERNTQQLVQSFTKKYQNDVFRQKIESVLNPMYEKGIRFLTESHQPELLMLLWKKLSAFQFANFQEMIPPAIGSLWKKGLETGDFALKLCGAGGGGYFLGMKRESHVSDYMEEWSLTLIESP